MRVLLVLAALVGVTFASVRFLEELPPGPASDASSAEREIARGRDRDATTRAASEERPGGSDLHDWFAGADVDAAATGTAVFYQYVDDRGSVNLVESLELVPPEWRDRAGRMEVEVRAPSAPAPRSFGRRADDGPLWGAFAYTPDPTAVVYTTPWCGWCRKTLAHLDEKGVRYQNRDIEADEGYRDELIRKTGKTSVPVVEIDGTLIRGYNPRRMNRLLAAAG